MACLVLTSFIALSLWALHAGPASVDSSGDVISDNESGDIALYERIVERVRGGDDYYAAAVDEQQQAGYPTWPPPAVRMPTLTWLHDALGDHGAVWLLWTLIGATLIVAMIQLDSVARSLSQWAVATLLVVAAMGVYLVPVAASVHDVWAGVLCMLAVLVRGRSGPLAIAFGLTAVVFRELAAPFILLMAALAWRHRRRESLGWLAALAAFVALYAIHWAAVSHSVGDGGVIGQSWLSLGGWPFVVDAVRFSSPLRAFPQWVTVLVLPLALLGWLFVRSDISTRLLAYSAAFMVMLSVVGRPDNVYWATLFVAMLLPGLAFAPGALVVLVSLLRRGALSPDES